MYVCHEALSLSWQVSVFTQTLTSVEVKDADHVIEQSKQN